MVSVYEEVLTHYGVRVPSWTSTIEHWARWQTEGLLEKYLKWSTAYLLAQVLDQHELPPSPHPEFVVGVGPFFGGFTTHLKRILLFHRLRSGGRTPRARILAFSLYQGKAGSLPVSEHFLKKSLETAVERLTNLHPPNEADHLEFSDDLADCLVRVVEEVFPLSSAEQGKAPGEWRTASTHSSFQSSRKMGGNLNWIAYDDRIEVALRFRDLYWMEDRAGRVYTHWGPPLDLWTTSLEDSTIRARRVVEETGGVRCYPVGLLEPFKVRVITRGDADVYHLCRRYQRPMHRILSSHPTFRLTRGPITQDVMDDLCRALPGGQLPEGSFWVSGDYEAATDYLDPSLSRLALSMVVQRMGVPLEDRPVLLAALTDHQIGDPKDRGSAPEFKSQKWGQLMGSPISFPILCLVNAAATLLALERRAGRRFRLRSLPLLINGDDVGFVTDEEGYDLWKRITAVAGLKFSIGKNYTSRDVLILNSEMWASFRQVDFFGQWTTRLWREPHLPVGLLFGQVRVSSDPNDRNPLDSDEDPILKGRSLAQCARDLLRGQDPRTHDRLMTSFIRINNRLLRESVPVGMSWFVPRSLGGVGLPVTRDVSSQISEDQRRLATYLMTRDPSDPDLRDLSSPLRPAFLDIYQKEQARRRGVLGLGTRWVTPSEARDLSDPDTFRGLAGYQVYGSLPLDQDMHCRAGSGRERLQALSRAFYRLKSRAKAAVYCPTSDNLESEEGRKGKLVCARLSTILSFDLVRVYV